jgi:hypothetical protein
MAVTPNAGVGMVQTVTLSEVLRDRFWLRALVFLACIPSGGAVLTEVYGVASLHDVVWYAAVPGYLIVAAVWLIGRGGRFGDISQAIAIGAVGGFLGVIAYDVARIPFIFAGYRIFAQNSSYGLWILDADYSTRFTTLAGWIYHFANGTLFGVMYAVFMRGRHWAWAIAWAFLLETIALTSPYGRIYHITSAVLISVAYYGHIAYGLPLGLMTRDFAASATSLADLSPVLRIVAIVLIGAAMVGPLLSPTSIAADRAARPGLFTVEGERLAPSWQRLNRGGQVLIRNNCKGPAVIIADGKPALQLAPCQQGVLAMPAAGVHLIALPPKGLRTQSSFVLVDPVSEAP